MATVIPHWSCAALRYTCRIPSRRKLSPLASRLESFHTSTIHRYGPKDDPEDGLKDDPEDGPKVRTPYVFDVSSLSSQARDQYNTLSSEEKDEFRETSKKIHQHMTSRAVESKLQQSVSYELQDAAREDPRVELKFPKIKPGFFAAGEDDPQDVGADEEFAGDDMTSIAHGQLEQHREIREYMRIAAWEMPMLSSSSSTSTSTKNREELIESQNSPSHSRLHRSTILSASAIPLTWAKRIRPRRKLFLNFASGTCPV